MREERLAAIKQRLLDLRRELYAEVLGSNREAAALNDEGVPDIGDQGLTDNLREYLHLLSDSRREELLEVDEALDRWRAGTYGICQGCGKPIPIERLEALPFTRFDTACQQARELEAKRRSGPGKGTF
jgi:RNA polymerase-binding transcription factor